MTMSDAATTPPFRSAYITQPCSSYDPCDDINVQNLCYEDPGHCWDYANCECHATCNDGTMCNPGYI